MYDVAVGSVLFCEKKKNNFYTLYSDLPVFNDKKMILDECSVVFRILTFNPSIIRKVKRFALIFVFGLE